MSARRSRRDESGVYALIFAALTLALMMAAAFTVDIASQVNSKQQLTKQLDTAAQAGSFRLDLSSGSAARARADAVSFAQDNGSDSTLYIDFWCVVARGNPGTNPATAKASQIPRTCNPGGTAPWRVDTLPHMVCSELLCAIPCPEIGAGITCNTIRVSSVRDVPFTFGPAGGVPKGRTGAVVSVACKGPCGSLPPNPMDVAVVADRTSSMDDTELSQMVTGIRGMLKVMTPSQQYVALGTIGRSSVSATPSSEPSASCPVAASGSRTSGAWIPVPFTNDYLNANESDLNTTASSALVRSVGCLDQSSTGTALAAPMKAAARYLLGGAYATNNLSSLPGRPVGVPRKVLIFETDGEPNESTGGGPTGSTSLDNASDPFAGDDTSTTVGPVTTSASTPTQTTQTRIVTPSGCHQQSCKKTYTDTLVNVGQTDTRTTTTTYYDNGDAACNNLGAVASNAKAAGILVITIAYGLSGTNCGATHGPPMSSSSSAAAPKVVVSPASCNAGTVTNQRLDLTCGQNATVTTTTVTTVTVTNRIDDGEPTVLGTLAAAASPVPGGGASTSNGCATAAAVATENADGDFFFCAAAASDLANIFEAALGQAVTGITLMNLP